MQMNELFRVALQNFRDTEIISRRITLPSNTI